MDIKGSVSSRGVKGSIRYTLQKLLGLERIQEEVDSLYYFLNNAIDITKLPPTSNEDLRLVQIGILEQVKVMDKLFEQDGLRYWLAYGSLLGAARHKGFIPWDDDFDVMMPREDYVKVLGLYKEKMEKYGITVRSGGDVDSKPEVARLSFGYKTVQTGIWIDIFPYDVYYSDLSYEEALPILKVAIKKYQSWLFDQGDKLSSDEIYKKKREIILSYPELNGTNTGLCVANPEWSFGSERYWNLRDVEPIIKTEFEDTKLPVSNNIGAILSERYGMNYMQFPRYGLEHHANADGTVSGRAKKYGVNMHEVIQYLKDVYSKI